MAVELVFEIRIAAVKPEPQLLVTTYSQPAAAAFENAASAMLTPRRLTARFTGAGMRVEGDTLCPIIQSSIYYGDCQYVARQAQASVKTAEKKIAINLRSPVSGLGRLLVTPAQNFFSRSPSSPHCCIDNGSPDHRIRWLKI